ncbi:SMP-30/gluconolactonase/LRE family protein [Cohnella kolymensis]|uniref:SMP-30/gluconolactonase/LRE family protein n=1 Tax=Cohnella kolymensis TaxID=1590652 RepID=UPI000AA27993|nr:SMP-30/gluconolactonase/LRE family protein [Cohnella kolymensis]
MRKKFIVTLAVAMIWSVLLSTSMFASEQKEKKHHSWEVSIVVDLDANNAAGMRIEGLTGDKQGRLYTSDLNSRRLIRVTPHTGAVEVLTVLPQSATGMVFDKDGNLYMASGGGPGVDGVILRVSEQELKKGSFTSDKVETFAVDVDGANGLVFDRDGNLYVSGGATGNIYVITPDGERTVWASGISADRPTQPIVVNGLAFGRDGRLYIANTSSGEINRVSIKKDGTFGAVERFAKDPLLYGADGIAFGPNGDLYVAANERNAIVKVSHSGKVTEIAGNNNEGPLEFPASLHFIGSTLYASNFDIDRGVNSPNSPGIGASIAKIEFVQEHSNEK